MPIPVLSIDMSGLRRMAEERSQRYVTDGVRHVPPSGPCSCGCGRYVDHPAPRSDGRVYSRECWVAGPKGYGEAPYADPDMERRFASFPSPRCSRCGSAFGAEHLRDGLCLQCALAGTRGRYGPADFLTPAGRPPGDFLTTSSRGIGDFLTLGPSPGTTCSGCKRATADLETIHNGWRLCPSCREARCRWCGEALRHGYIHACRVAPRPSNVEPSDVRTSKVETDADRYRAAWRDLRERARTTREHYAAVISDSENFRKAAGFSACQDCGTHEHRVQHASGWFCQRCAVARDIRDGIRTTSTFDTPPAEPWFTPLQSPEERRRPSVTLRGLAEAAAQFGGTLATLSLACGCAWVAGHDDALAASAAWAAVFVAESWLAWKRR